MKYFEIGLYSRSRHEFIKDTTNFVHRQKFDGLNLYWSNYFEKFVFICKYKNGFRF